MSGGNLRQVDLNLLRVFDAIYAERHVTRAAARLFTSQSAVSHSLRNLREIFKDALFVRTPDGMSPTAFADRMAVRITGVLEEMRDILALRDEFIPANADGKITIGLLSPTPPWLIPNLCRAVGALAPRLSLAFRFIALDQVVDALDNRIIQIGVGSHAEANDRQRFLFEPLFEDALTCVVARDHPLGDRVFDIETYAGLPHLVIATGHFTRTWIDDLLAQSELKRSIRLLIPSPHHVGDLLSGTDLVCTVMRSLVLPDERLRVLAPPFEAAPISIGQCTHSRDEGNPQIVWLRQMVRETCRAALAPQAI
jgi:DNA-binding transcriptional LysR family regulator